MIHCKWTRRHYYRVGFCDAMNGRHTLMHVLKVAGEDLLMRAYLRGRVEGEAKRRAKKK